MVQKAHHLSLQLVIWFVYWISVVFLLLIVRNCQNICLLLVMTGYWNARCLLCLRASIHLVLSEELSRPTVPRKFPHDQWTWSTMDQDGLIPYEHFGIVLNLGVFGKSKYFLWFTHEEWRSLASRLVTARPYPYLQVLATIWPMMSILWKGQWSGKQLHSIVERMINQWSTSVSSPMFLHKWSTSI